MLVRDIEKCEDKLNREKAKSPKEAVLRRRLAQLKKSLDLLIAYGKDDLP